MKAAECLEGLTAAPGSISWSAQLVRAPGLDPQAEASVPLERSSDPQ